MLNSGDITRPDFLQSAKAFTFHFRPAMLIITNTKVLGQMAFDACKQLPFNCMITSPRHGNSEGVWVLWRSNRVECQAFDIVGEDLRLVITDRKSVV